MQIEVFLTIGFPTATRKGVIDVPDEDLEGLDDEARESVIDEYIREWAYNFIEYGRRV